MEVSRIMIINRINEIKGIMNQKDFGEIIGCGQSKVSALLSYKDTREFSLDEIVKIAKHFNVSADYILGLTDERTPRTPPEGSRVTPRQFCEMLVYMKDKQYYPIKLRKISAEETRVFIHNGGIERELIECDYLSLHFSDYDGDGNEYIGDDKEGNPIFEQAPNFQEKAHSINTFLEHWQRIHAAYDGGSIDYNDYKYLIQKRLSEVME